MLRTGPPQRRRAGAQHSAVRLRTSMSGRCAAAQHALHRAALATQSEDAPAGARALLPVPSQNAYR